MKNVFLVIALVSSSFALADEAYQMKNATGLWKTLDYPWATTELLIRNIP